ncbi:NUDIX hydrolase N-terminal domain-containing protein [Erysipelotrichaceae bacterium OttesenSCG-928-M19]|nr:NUDIX hydrolase N-terminal domain-containing protein [Erysipelotrichaceae bacterium OttesenSCG-928-M19]
MDYLEFIIKMQGIAKIGLKFSKDAYALENYAQIESLSKAMLEKYTQQEIEKDNYFVRDIYPTPNISVRVIIEEQGKLLMVREIKEQKYSVPGGWCDLFENAKENAISEVLQESGYEVEIERLLAIFNRSEYLPKKSSVSEYALYFSAKIIGGCAQVSHETDDVAFFEIEKLPQLSFKNTQQELNKALDVYYNDKETYFD